ncbi:Intraflagellar transport protein 43, variant 2 [Chamberlinius hualienensis]
MNQLLQIVKRSSPKKGRRAGSDSNQGPSDLLQNHIKGFEAKGASGEGPPKPPRKNVDGWSENSTSFHRNKEDSNDFRRSINDDEDKGNIGVIPDLDDFLEEDFVSQVAKAPNVSVNRVATYKELDNDLHRNSAFVTLNDIDLKALTRYMSLEADVKEDDNPWTWDSLMADISSKLIVDQLTEEEAT